VPFGRFLADHNDTSLPVKQSGGTYVCPMDASGCCSNPGEDADENAVVSSESEKGAERGRNAGFMHGDICSQA
jgi:hypothetical protein